MRISNSKIAKTLLATSVLCMAASSFAQRRNPRDYDRDTRSRHDSLRTRHADMNICSELENDLIEKELAYHDSEDNLVQVRRNYSQAQSTVNSRRNNLQRRQSDFSSAQSTLQSTTYRQDNRVSITRDARALLNASNSALPGAIRDRDNKQRIKDDKCKGFIRVGRRARACKAAKEALKNAKRVVDTHKSNKRSAQNTLNDIATIDTQVQNAQRRVTTTQNALTVEQRIQPSISQLESSVRALANERATTRDAYIVSEELFIKAELKHNRCITMRYEARKAPVFKKYLVKYTSQGCTGVTEDIRYERGRAAKAGVEEAYKLVCDSEVPLCSTPSVDPVNPAGI